MSKHTPGPWRLYEFNPTAIGNGDGKTVTVIWNGSAGEMTDEDCANARLIAAAPDLLAAVEYLFPRAHRHLVDQAEIEKIGVILTRIEGGLDA